MELQTTQSAVPVDVRKPLTEALNITLGTAVDLHWQVKQAHWNLRGPWFFARHQLFDQLADRARLYADQLAERVGALGGAARGSVRMAAESSVLPPYEVGLADGEEHIEALIDRYARWTRQLRLVRKQAAQLDEAATEDLIIEGLRQAELDLWFLEGHLSQSPAVQEAAQAN